MLYGSKTHNTLYHNVLSIKLDNKKTLWTVLTFNYVAHTIHNQFRKDKSQKNYIFPILSSENIEKSLKKIEFFHTEYFRFGLVRHTSVIFGSFRATEIAHGFMYFKYISKVEIFIKMHVFRN